MTDAAMTSTSASVAAHSTSRRDFGLKKRHRAEALFRFYGVAAITIGLLFLVLLLGSIISKGYTAFVQTSITVPVEFTAAIIAKDDKRATDPKVLVSANYPVVARNAVAKALGISPDDKAAMKGIAKFVSDGSRSILRQIVLDDPSVIGTTRPVTLLVAADIDSANKGQIDLTVPESKRKVSDQQVTWLNTLKSQGAISTPFNWGLITFGASSRPETAGLGVALIGSAYMMLIVLVLALPIGVAASIYLEEFAKKSRLTDIIEVNINNLAAVPSIVFGLLGLAVLLGFFGLPRGAPLVGGMVLSLMTLPTIIIATRAALKAVPPSIREAAYGVGASKQQVVMHHVLPLAMPGVMTGAIIGTARAMGESAAVLMIGMVAFIVDVPTSITDSSTVLPVQIFLWADAPERGFVERTSAGIMVMLVFLVLMNAAAVVIRRKFERRW